MSPANTTPSSTVLLLDVTDQMDFPAAEPAVLDLVNLFQPGNRFALRSYADLVYRTFPDEGLETYDDRGVIDDACFAVEGLRPRGIPCDMTAAILAGKSLLRRQTGPRAMVMVSASPWTVGGNPVRAVSEDIPIHTVGYQNQGQLETLERIAARSGGTFSTADDPRELFTTLANLSETLKLTLVLAQANRTLTDDKSVGITGRVDDGADLATVVVYWEDRHVVYGDTAPAEKRWIEVKLIQPDLDPYPGAPAYIGPGFVVFAVPRPAAGNWVAETIYHGRGDVTVLATMYRDAG